MSTTEKTKLEDLLINFIYFRVEAEPFVTMSEKIHPRIIYVNDSITNGTSQPHVLSADGFRLLGFPDGKLSREFTEPINPCVNDVLGVQVVGAVESGNFYNAPTGEKECDIKYPSNGQLLKSEDGFVTVRETNKSGSVSLRIEEIYLERFVDDKLRTVKRTAEKDEHEK